MAWRAVPTDKAEEKARAGRVSPLGDPVGRMEMEVR
jgi:hypothetical protein